jgi:hypothetical protein
MSFDQVGLNRSASLDLLRRRTAETSDMRTNGEGAGDIRPLPRSCITPFREKRFAGWKPKSG